MLSSMYSQICMLKLSINFNIFTFKCSFHTYTVEKGVRVLREVLVILLWKANLKHISLTFFPITVPWMQREYEKLCSQTKQKSLSFLCWNKNALLPSLTAPVWTGSEVASPVPRACQAWQWQLYVPLFISWPITHNHPFSFTLSLKAY